MASSFDQISGQRPARNTSKLYKTFERVIAHYIEIRTEKALLSAIDVDDAGNRKPRLSLTDRHFALDVELATVKALGKDELHAAWANLILKMAGVPDTDSVDARIADEIVRLCGKQYTKKRLHHLGWYYANQGYKAA